MTTSSAKIRVAFSVINSICFDQRVLKIAGTVSELGCDITIIGRRLADGCDNKELPFKTRRFNMIINRGFLFYKFFNIRLFIYLLFHKFDLLVSNDLDTLLPNYLVSELKKIPLVYDSHEYFTEVPELKDRHFVKWVWTKIEEGIFPRLKHVITVSDSIAAEYEGKYGLRPVVIRNCSKKSETITPCSREELGIGGEQFLLILQGGGLNIDKGGEELIEAIALTENVSLIIAGSGDVLPVIKKKAEDLKLTGRIKFYPKMQWEDLMKYTRAADAGLCLEKDTNLNYRFSLPNKLFDYISAGIPVIAGDLPEIRKIVEGTGCGIIIPAITPEEISRAVMNLKESSDLLKILKQNAISVSEKLIWDLEAEKVIGFYNQILKSVRRN